MTPRSRVENPLLDLDPLEVLRVSLNISLAPDSGRCSARMSGADPLSGLERQERALALVQRLCGQASPDDAAGQAGGGVADRVDPCACVR